MRTPRKQCESEIYHVISRGTGRQLIFEGDDDRELFLDILEECARGTSVEVYAWCLMGNHVHLLLHAPISRIANCMKSLCGRYAQTYNRQHGRVGHLFQERFKSEPVEDEAYLISVVSYIHYNPEKAGMANQEEYRWSSYKEYVGGHDTRRICSTDFVLGVFGGVEEFVRHHDNHAAETACMDIDAAAVAVWRMSDEDAIALAEQTLDGIKVNDLKTFDRPTRNSAIGDLLSVGLSIRQIERLTGISRGVIQTVHKS